MPSYAIYLRLPWVPSVNHYYRFVPGARSPKISEAGRVFRNKVKAAVWDTLGGFPQPLTGHLSVIVDLYPPDKRVRDIDNCYKGLMDSLTKARVWQDDSQIKSLWGRMHEPTKGGMVLVQIEEMATPAEGDNQ